MRPYIKTALRAGSPFVAALLAVAVYRHWAEPDVKRTRNSPSEAAPAPTADAPQTLGKPRGPRPVSQTRSVEAPPAVESAVPAEPDVPRRAPSDREAAAREERDNHARLLEAHRREPRDLTWARDMEHNINSMFETAKDVTGGTIESVSCKSATCAVSLHWPSAAAARAHLVQTVQIVGPGAGCQRQLTLPEVRSEDEEVSATLLFDCTELRWPQGQ
ncbi:MAG: hypothetical protein QM820_33995 [Minicystis sp.]